VTTRNLIKRCQLFTEIYQQGLQSTLQQKTLIFTFNEHMESLIPALLHTIINARNITK